MSDLEKKVEELQSVILHTVECMNNLIYDSKQNDTSVFARRLVKKFSMVDSIFRKENTLFYLPNYPRDRVQTIIVDSNSFYTQDILESLDKYLSKDCVIADIGSNIGSNVLYWTMRTGVKQVYAFEALPEVYQILLKNIELNGIQCFVSPFNNGLSDENCDGKITKYSTLELKNTEIAKLSKEELQFFRGNRIPLKTLDSLDLPRLDFIRIDSPNNAIAVLKGARETILKYSPKIFIESYGEKEAIDTYMNQIGYKIIESFGMDKALYGN